ncbi:MAG TPA: exodeoxyribonuclease III, partial [Polyangiaceae bacterium]|nr:exodeoxyribonuclease III [Polyangiaceae bacterium]
SMGSVFGLPAWARAAIGRRLKLASWNVNSIRARLENVAGWLAAVQPDVLCLQETKVVDDDFPREEFTRLGYSLATVGQPGYNGVAIASRLPLDNVCVDLPGADPTRERRLIAADIAGVRVINVYVPNGKGVNLPSFQDKLRWFERLRLLLDTQHTPEENVLVCGDFNVAREARDVYDPALLAGQLLFHPDERRALERVIDFGLVDVFRRFHERAGEYSWWDYRAGSVRMNRGLRIDYVLLSGPLAQRCQAAWIDREPRSAPKPSDHAPVLVELT